jgi:uncharacterized membrane protein (DUF4010 family)
MSTLLGYIAVSACLGALIGLIRQWAEQSDGKKDTGDFAGVRTHTLWAVLGCLGMAASLEYTPLAFPAVLLAISAHLIAQRAKAGDEAPGSTSFAAALLTMFCGALIAWEETRPAVLVAATTMLMVGAKQAIHRWTREITQQDIRATLQFVAISGVILPLVPHRDMGPYGAFNPYSTWLMVVLICGMGFAGYVAIRVIGAKAGILLMGLLGGLASSTASTLAFSRRSKEAPKMAAHYALAVVAACTVMLPRVLVAIGLLNRELAIALVVPFALMAAPGIGYAVWVWLRQRREDQRSEAPALGNPLSLATAIKFALLYTVIAFLVKVVRAQGWTEGLLPLSFVSGLTDMDAISLSIARDVGTAATDFTLAVRAIILAAIANTLLKAGMAIALGSPGLKVRIAIILGATAVAGVAAMLLGSQLFAFTRAE